MTRTPLIAANWKMYKNVQQTRDFFSALLPLLDKHSGSEITVCVPFPLIPTSIDATKGSRIAIGAQDVFWEKEGAYTGEVSAEMLTDAGCKHVIIGHSERRQYFGETNQTVNKKLKTALEVGLTPIVCIGELLEQREAGETDYILKRQYLEGFSGIDAGRFSRCVIAYEPVWAIGTGKTATPEMASQAHAVIRSEIERSFGEQVASAFRILYGGSVKPDNARALMSQEQIDGALVGGASLDARSFAAIVGRGD